MVAVGKRGSVVRPLRTFSTEEGGRTYTDTKDPEFKGMAATQGARRRAFERSDNPRTTGLDLRGDMAAEYERRGWHDLEAQHAQAAPSMHDYDRLAATGNNPFPQPTRWEHLSSDQQGRAIAGLKAHGTSLGKMTQDLGRGLDRAYMRSEKYGHVAPFAANFYEPEGHARQTLTRTLPEITDVQQAAATSITSPKNKFIQVTDAGETQIPNVNAAVTAAHFAKIGHESGWGPEDYRSIPGEDLNARGREVSGGGVGLHMNARRASFVIGQGLGGREIEDVRGFPTQADYKRGREGDPVFGDSPKASPFAGSFIDQAAPFNVLDVHMAGVVFPHLSGIKGSGVNINPSGAETGGKSERELAVERIPHSHAAVDFAMREAMGERGLSKTRFQQGGIWGEEQITRTTHPEPGARRLGYNPEKMYGWQSNFTRRTKRGTGTLYLPG